MIEQKKQWLLGVSWDSVIHINRTLCQAHKLEPKTNAKRFANAQAWWEKSSQKTTNLLGALDLCRQAFDQSPFTFNNGNTFAAVARSLVEDALRHLPAVEAQIVRTTIGHYVAGIIERKEAAQVLEQFAPLLDRSLNAAPAATPRPAAPEVPAPQLASPRPVAS